MGGQNSGKVNKPVALHVLHGDPSHLGKKELEKRADVQYEPMEDLTPPSYFNDFEKQCWGELAEKFKNSRVLSVMDAWALELLIESYAEWREHKEYLDSNGYTVEEGSERAGWKTRADPRCELKQKAHQRIVNLLLQFGWTPAARTKTQRLSTFEKDPIGNGFGKRPNV